MINIDRTTIYEVCKQECFMFQANLCPRVVLTWKDSSGEEHKIQIKLKTNK